MSSQANELGCRRKKGNRKRQKSMEKQAMRVRDTKPAGNLKDFEFAETKAEEGAVQSNFSHLVNIITSDFSLFNFCSMS